MLSRVLGAASIAILTFLLLLSTADARPVAHWSIERLAKEAPLIAVAEVIDVTSPGTKPRKDNSLDMHACVKILRMPDTSQAAGLAPGDEITVWYEAYDHISINAILNRYIFPQFVTGNCCVLPLKKECVDGADRWKLIDREDVGLIIPCLKRSPDGKAFETTNAFLIAELANIFALGDTGDLSKAAIYLRSSLPDFATIEGLHNRIASVVNDNESRWLDIAVITYNLMGIPRPSIASLHTGAATGPRYYSALFVAKALSHIPSEGFDEKFIRTSIDHMDVSTWGTGITFSQNYASNQLAISLLAERLQAENRSAIDVSQYMLRANPNPTLLDAATDASINHIVHSTKLDTNSRAAFCVIKEHGSEEQFNTLLQVLKKSLQDDPSTFYLMWGYLAYGNKERMIPIIRIALHDGVPLPNKQWKTISDSAIFELQRVTGIQFGLTRKSTDAERNEALKKAWKWLAENP